MSRRLLGISLVISAMFTSSSFAGFIVSAFKTPNAFPGRDQIDLYGLNTGGGTGTQIKIVDLRLSLDGTSKLFLRVDDVTGPTGTEDVPDGIADTVQLFNETSSGVIVNPGLSSIKVSRTKSNNVYEPSLIPVQPNPYINGVSSFNVVVANTGTTPANSGIGFRFAALFVSAGSDGTIRGRLASESVAENYGPIQISTIGITPEPTSLAALILSGALGLIRHRNASR